MTRLNSFNYSNLKDSWILINPMALLSPRMPQDMQSVLLLRTEALGYRKAFEDAGYQVAFLPVLSKSGSNDWLASNSPASFDGLVVTSAAALEPLQCRAFNVSL